MIASPVAGLRPMRAGRLRTWKMPRPGNADLVALLEVLDGQVDEVAKKRGNGLLGHFVLFCQFRGEFRQRHRHILTLIISHVSLHLPIRLDSR